MSKWLAMFVFVGGCTAPPPVDYSACEAWIHSFARNLSQIQSEDWRLAMKDKELQNFHEARTSETLAIWSTIEQNCLGPYRDAAKH